MKVMSECKVGIQGQIAVALYLQCAGAIWDHMDFELGTFYYKESTLLHRLIFLLKIYK